VSLEPLNLLYYVSSHGLDDRDDLELWPRGPSGQPLTVIGCKGRLERALRGVLLRADVPLRRMVRKPFSKGIGENPHYCRKETR
jgi:hypothetical protein